MNSSYVKWIYTRLQITVVFVQQEGSTLDSSLVFPKFTSDIWEGDYHLKHFEIFNLKKFKENKMQPSYQWAAFI